MRAQPSVSADKKEQCYSALPKTVIDFINAKYPAKEAKYVINLLIFIDSVPMSRKKFVHIRGSELQGQISYTKYRSKYRKYIQVLAKNDIININHSYSNDKTKAYSKSYKSNLDNQAGEEWEVFDTYKNKYKTGVTDIENQCDIRFRKQFLYTLHHEHQLIFCDDLNNLVDKIKKSDLNKFAYDYHKITNKIVGRRKDNSESSRFYNNSVMLKNEHKQFLRYKSNNQIKKVVNYDFASFVPTIIKLLANNKQLGNNASCMLTSFSAPYFINNKQLGNNASCMLTSFSAPYFNNNKQLGNNASCMLTSFSAPYFINNKQLGNNASCMWTHFSDPYFKTIKKEMCSLYTDIQHKLKLDNRDEAKEKFSQFRNATIIKKRYLPLNNTLKEMNQSDMIEVMENTDWRVYDEIETMILADISDIAEKHNLVFIRQHDGWLTTEQDGLQIMTELEKIGLTNLFDIKATPLNQ